MLISELIEICKIVNYFQCPQLTKLNYIEIFTSKIANHKQKGAIGILINYFINKNWQPDPNCNGKVIEYYLITNVF